MKKILLACMIVFCICGIAQAEPWAVCDPQSDADGYIWRLDGGAWTETVYAVGTCSDGPCVKIADVGEVSTGSHRIEVYAFKDDAVWGRSVSATVPLDFARPSLGAPQTIRLKR